jgi:hypothetical protein
LPSSSTRRTAWALKSSSNRRRGRRFGVSAIGRDIVSPIGKMSTKPDQAHDARKQEMAADRSDRARLTFKTVAIVTRQCFVRRGQPCVLADDGDATIIMIGARATCTASVCDAQMT